MPPPKMMGRENPQRSSANSSGLQKSYHVSTNPPPRSFHGTYEKDTGLFQAAWRYTRKSSWRGTLLSLHRTQLIWQRLLINLFDSPSAEEFPCLKYRLPDRSGSSHARKHGIPLISKGLWTTLSHRPQKNSKTAMFDFTGGLFRG